MADNIPSDPPGQLYSILVEDALVLKNECEKQLLVLEDLFPYFLEDNLRKHGLSLICESYSLNYKVYSLLKKIFKNSEKFFPEDSSKEEMVVTASDMLLLQTVTVARYYLSQDLVMHENISTSFH